MIQNFLRIYKCVNHALSDFSMPVFTDKEIKILSALSNTLRPLDVAIKELSKDSATLIELEGIIKFLINNLDKANNSFSKDLIVHLKSRINDRRIKVLNTLVLYLNSGTFPINDNFLKYSSKTETKDFASKMYDRLFHTEANQNISDDDIVLEEEEEINDINENNLLLELNDTIKSIQNVKKSNVNCNIIDDFLYLDKTKKRSENLEKLFNAILSVSPTSTLSERVFSKSSFIKTKQKNRLKAKHLNCILFLKDYFRRCD